MKRESSSGEIHTHIENKVKLYRVNLKKNSESDYDPTNSLLFIPILA